jgi:hypothetical protein
MAVAEEYNLICKEILRSLSLDRGKSVVILSTLRMGKYKLVLTEVRNFL